MTTQRTLLFVLLLLLLLLLLTFYFFVALFVCGCVRRFVMMGRDLIPIDEAPAGNVVAIAGLQDHVRRCITLLLLLLLLLAWVSLV